MLVASFTDAWIETKRVHDLYEEGKVASFTDAWIETLNGDCHLILILSHLLQMRGLKLMKERLRKLLLLSHLLQMRGLKLKSKYNRSFRTLSHLLQMRGLKLS